MTSDQIIQFAILILAVDAIVFLIFHRANRRLRLAMEGQRRAEMDVKNSKDRLDLALLSSGIGTWDLSISDGTMIFDEGMNNLFGMNPGDFAGTRESFRAMINPDDLPAYERSTLAAMEGRAPFETEFRIIRRDGKTRILRARGQVYRDEKKAPVRMLGMCEDITAERESGEQIRKLSQAVEQSPIMVIITDLSGNIEYVNPRFSEITGFTREEAIGQNPRFLKGPSQSQESSRNLWATIASGKIWKGEFCNRKKNGEIFWADASISPVLDASRKPTHFLAIQEDITTRKEMEQALKAAKEVAESATEAKSQFLANMSHEIRTPMNAIMGLSYLCQQTDLSKRQSDYLKKITVAANNLLGIINDILDFSKAEAGKMTLEAIEFDLDEILDQLSDLVTGKAQDKGLEVVFVTAPTVPTRLVGDPLRLGQILINLANNAVKYTPSGDIVISTTVEKRVDHEAVLRFSITDSGIGLTPDQQKSLFKPFVQADSSITRRFGGTGLGLSICHRLVEMMGGKISVESAPNKGSTFTFTVKLEVVAERQELNPASDLRGLNVLVIDDSESAISAFRSQLQALSFVPATATNLEEATEKIKARQHDRPFNLILLDWKLPGMSSQEAIKQVRAATVSGKEPGRKIPVITVVPFGQEISAEKTLGTDLESLLVKPFTLSTLLDTVVCLFHKDQPSHRRASSKPSVSLETLERIRGSHILLVEDNEINQEFTSELLEKAGLKIEIAGNGLIAINKLEKKSYDCVLMDVQMPEMDGYTATRAIRRQSRFKDLPIIAMTAGAMSGDRENALIAGMNDYVTKPIDPPKLFAKLLQWVKPGLQSQAAQPTTSQPQDEKVPDESVDKIPSIPGMDVAAGVARIGGSLTSLLKVLKKFCTTNADAPEKIQRALETGNNDEARICAHTMAGVAGNLGIKSVEDAARALESAIVRSETEKHQELLKSLSENLNKFLKGVASAMPDQAAENQTAQTASPGNVSGQLEALMTSLAEQLRQGDAEARETIEKIRLSTGMPAASEPSLELQEVAALIERYAFEDALEKIPALERSLAKICQP